MSTEFVHLRVHSSYSLSEGAITPYDIMKLCQKHQMNAVGISDSYNLFGSLEFSQAGISNKIQPIIGCIVALDAGNFASNNKGSGSNINSENYDDILLIAKDKTGYQNLLKIVSRSYTQSIAGEKPHVTSELLYELSDGLILLTGGISGPIGRLLLAKRKKDAEKLLLRFKDHFGDRIYVEIMRHGIMAEEETEDDFIDLAYKHNIPLVATNNVFFATPDIYSAHDALLCIASSRYVVEEERRKSNKEYYFKSAREMRTLFADLPEALENSLNIAKRCFVMAESRNSILPCFGDDKSKESEILKMEALAGLNKRLADHVYKEEMSLAEKENLAKPYLERLEFELNVIIKMDFSGYFLIVSDFMKYSKRSDIPIGPGRGSGAGSVVAWSLEITDLDPLRFGLLFERFLNPERISMPDFDIDFCQERREEVIRYVQSRYGHDRVAQIITFGKLQARAVIRDVGRVLQIPYSQVDRISKMIPSNPIDPVTLEKALSMDKTLRDMQQNDKEVGRLLDIALKLEGLNRHCSTHAAGVVIGDRPLEELVPVYRDPKSDMPVCGYSMKYAESAGLVKFDFLGLKTLTVIAKACSFIKRRGIDLDISKIPLDDPLTYKMLSEGKSVGVFQLESAGMRDVLRKLRPDNIDDIIALISLYRPGPMDNIPAYIARKHKLEDPDYLHPMLEEVLKETYGVIIYQEQVMQIAQIMGGYSLGGADLLRRAMGKKIASEMDKQRDIFVKGALNNKVEKSQASYIFDLVAKFAGYGFNKSHAAAYAMISYRTAYLKANYPVEFFAASMNLEISDTDKINTFVQDIREHNITILPPDINKSFTYFVPEKLTGVLGEIYGIRYALAACKNVGVNVILNLEDERAKNGEFTSVFDLVARLGSGNLNKRMIENLIRAGAFDSLNKNRRQLFDNVELFLKYTGNNSKQKESVQSSLFDLLGEVENKGFYPELKAVNEWEQTVKLQEEFQSLGLYLDQHPLSSYDNFMTKLGIVYCGHFSAKLPEGYSQVKLVGVVISKKIRSSQKGKFASVTLSDPTGIFEISIYDEDLLATAQDLLISGNILYILSDIRKDEGGTRAVALEVKSFDDLIKEQQVTYNLYLKNLAVITSLKNYIKNSQNSNVTINFKVPVQKQLITISLNQNYSVSSEAIINLRSINGVVKVEEI